MLACVLNSDGHFELVTREKPKAKKDTAVIKVIATSICGTDFRTYMFGSGKIKPGTVMGHEVCGQIVEVGENIKGFKVNEYVTVTPALGCGECSMCRKGHSNMCDNLMTLGFEFDGSFAEYMEIPAPYFERDYVNKVPAGVVPSSATLAEPTACAINAQQSLQIEKGDYVAVFGSGFIGCIHTELAFASGAEKVIMIEPNPVRLSTATKLLPRLCTVSGSDDLVSKVMEMTGGHGVDVAIVACSVGAAQVNAQKIIAKRGRISLFGGLPGESCGFIDSNVIHYKELGVFGIHASTTAQNRKALGLISSHIIDVEKYIEGRYPLTQILQALEDIKTKGIMKAVVVAEPDAVR